MWGIPEQGRGEVITAKEVGMVENKSVEAERGEKGSF